MRRRTKLWNSYVRWFDRSFSSGWTRQVMFLCALLVFFIVLWTSVMHLCRGGQYSEIAFTRTLELMLDPGAFQEADEGSSSAPNDFPMGLRLLITLSGAVIFTAMLITVLGNIISNRIDNYKKGRVRYHFDDHILVLGASSMLVSMLREFIDTKVHQNKKIVVLTAQDTEQLHDRIVSDIDGVDDYLDITFLNGSRIVEQTLVNVQIDEAYSIYILGEDNEVDHDSVNLRAWDLVRKLCVNVRRRVQCYLVVDRVSTYHTLQYGKKPVDTYLHLNIIHSLENWAQRVLVSREYDIEQCGTMVEKEKFPAIDREGIDENSSKTVRFVIFGMTQMSYAMAATVAHIAHFPNFIKDPSKRTKICFVAPDIKEEMDFFLGHYDNLFQLSHAKYFSWDKNGISNAPVSIREPEPELGDFLDIEWEFIDSSIESEQVRGLLSQWACADDEYLTVAICKNESDANVAAALYLPDIIYTNRIPVFVYQPLSGEVLKYAHSTNRYSNVYPFGMKDECFDPMFRKRIVKAKRINYLYALQNTGQMYCGMGSWTELDQKWNSLDEYVYRFSNLYAANSIPAKLRSVGIDPDTINESTQLSPSQVDILSVVEHNRWNMERLLLGVYAIPVRDRNAINNLIASGGSDKNHGKTWANQLKANNRHKDITPYKDLPVDSKQYDTAIVANILDVIRDV